MSRRYVKKTHFNSLDQVKPVVKSVVSAKDNIESTSTDQTYFKRNYLEAIRQIIPKFYFADEAAVSGVHISFVDQLVNSHILANKNQETIFPVSALTTGDLDPNADPYLSSINTPAGFAKYFSKQYSPAQISTDDFQRNILYPLGKSFEQFATSEAFVDFVSGTFLSSIPMVCTGHHATADLAALTNNAYATDSSGTYRFLVNNLGWLYFLNRLGPTPAGGHASFDPSTAVAELMTNTLWRGRSIVLEDVMNIYQEYLWRNKAIWEEGGVTDYIIPADYVSGTTTPSGVHTSGTQLLDRLKTLNEILYSPHYLDSPDTYVEKAFETYIDSSTASVDGTLITKTQEAGPLTRFLDALSFSISDRLTEQGEIGVLYDIGKCPDEFLELLGELIGWRFIGGDVDKWRVQLRNAVFIYKMKGTKRAIQYLLDTLFSTGVFVVDTAQTVNELWESYVPDLIYYALATSSAALTDLNTYTPELARQFGVVNYSPTDLETNIKYIVDKILFDLVREFPDSFYLGANQFPRVQLAASDTGEPYLGPYHLMPPLDPSGGDGGNYVDNPQYMWQWPRFMTGSTHQPDSVYLDLSYDPSFIFYYRDRPYLIPPYEKRQYYTGTQVTESMIERIEYYLRCYGVDASFAASVASFIKDNLSASLEVFRVLNNFNLFTKEKKYPPNYDVIITNATKERTIDPISLLSLWNGKSSHFLMNFDASSFDWGTQALASTSKYGIEKVKSVLDQVIPAHSIPTILLSVSDVANSLSAVVDSDCREIRPNFNDLYEGSSTVTTNFATCAVNMLALADANGIEQHRFKRGQVDNVNDVLLSGSVFTAVNRNSLRRRNFHNLLPETKMFTRRGRNNPGSMELSSPHYSSGVGYMPLGFMPSSLSFKEVALRSSDGSTVGIDQLLDKANVHPVWEICQNLSSTNFMFGYYVSNTFASRAKQTGRGRYNPTGTLKDTSSCVSYGRRGQLQEVVYVMNKTHDQEAYLQASSIVSGYLLENGSINPSWETSSSLLDPVNFSSWYASIPTGVDDEASFLTDCVVKGMGNYLINKHSADSSLNYYEHFTFGQKVHQLYNAYLTDFSGHGTSNNYNLMGVPNFFSHTFGPLIYNSNFDIDGSALVGSSYIAASAPTYEVNVAYLGGSGILSLSGMDGKTPYALGTSAASDSGDLPLGSTFTNSITAPPCEFRNHNLVSSIELVDTSTPYSFSGHPIFSVFNLSRDDQSKYSYAKYLINNQVIKYHRGYDNDSLPRLRIKIDNSGSDKDGLSTKSINFLEPEHTYEIKVQAHNLDASSSLIGGLSLGCWIHTEPEMDEVWTYVPQLPNACGDVIDKWDRQLVSDLSGPQGILLAKNKAQSQPFPMGNLESLLGSGEGSQGPLTADVYDYRCWEPEVYETLVLGTNPKAITNVSDKTLTTLTFRFSTKNTSLIVPSSEYISAFGKVHRKNQKYTLEFFTMQGNSRQFIVFEDISIKDVTNYNKSVIQTKYGEAQLDVSDLKALFLYFKDISTGLASRNNAVTSGVMELSGGSRLNYRSNVAMYEHSKDANTKQVELVYINEG